MAKKLDTVLGSPRLKLVKLLISISERLVFERRLRKIYAQIFGNGINLVVDVGANRGQTIDFFKRINPRVEVFAFEPNSNLFELLKKKYSAQKNIRLFNLGISNQLGTKDFHQNVLDYTSTFETLNADSAYLRKKAKILGTSSSRIVEATYPVEVTTLSHFINKNIQQPIIDVLKIDVEGHEYACLLGLFDSPLHASIRYIQLEQHKDDMYISKTSFDDIVTLMALHGYKKHTVVKHGFANLDEVIFARTEYMR